MDEDTKAITVGLGAGLGGFAGLVRKYFSRVQSMISLFCSFSLADCGMRLLENLLRLVRSNELLLKIRISFFLYLVGATRRPCNRK
jgi:hypothetical protein